MVPCGSGQWSRERAIAAPLESFTSGANAGRIPRKTARTNHEMKKCATLNGSAPPSKHHTIYGGVNSGAKTEKPAELSSEGPSWMERLREIHAEHARRFARGRFTHLPNVLSLVIAFSVCGCTLTTYHDGGQRISRLAFGTNSATQSLAIVHGKDSVRLKGESDNQSDAMLAAVEGAVKATIEAVKGGAL